MVRSNVFAAVAALSLSSAVLGVPFAPRPQEAQTQLPDPSDFTSPLAFDPAVVAAFKANKLGDAAADDDSEEASGPEIINMSLAGLQGSNFTDFAPSGLGPAEQPSKRSIIGPDNRVLWTNREYPYSAMGRIQRSDGAVCSGALIGARHVVTARHCIPPEGQNVAIRFQPAYDQGETLGGYDVERIFRPDYGQEGWCANAYDWAIFILREEAGRKNGWLGLKVVNPDTQLNRAMFFHYGYPGDKGANRPYRMEGISASSATGCDRGSPVVTNTDSAGGQSGGPLWLLENGSRYVYGVHVGSAPGFSVTAGGPSLLEGYGNVLRDYPN
ncbi:glutamyl endopeptidase [Colletotrichum plurivorum]|uniref:Serine protease n=1 Tax=Colletotrichum plurivorum TaxID=2175906 RepID=A0A8H6KLP2_9PEZI|nr:glutamyl endopeptidase [Colletotrichum plurivorum]